MKLTLVQFVTLDGVSQGLDSSTEDTTAGWHPTTVLNGDPTQTVHALKSQPGRELQIHGSARLAKVLLATGLVDTLRVIVAERAWSRCATTCARNVTRWRAHSRAVSPAPVG